MCGAVFAKTFYKIDHGLPLKKFQSPLLQITMYNCFKSSYGMPQKSNFEPLFLIPYINDITEVLENTILFYVGEIQMFYKVLKNRCIANVCFKRNYTLSIKKIFSAPCFLICRKSFTFKMFF